MQQFERDGRDAMEFAQELRRQTAAIGVHVPDGAVGRMERHYRLLLRWNASAKLTTITSLSEIISRHFVESIFATPLVKAGVGELVDIGSGGGFPALPILILRPDLRGTLLEPATRKWAYLKTVIHEAGLTTRARVLRRRVDSRAEIAALGPFDYLTMRAVSGHEVLLGGAADGLRPGGRALLFVGEDAAARIEASLPSGLVLASSVPLPGRRASFLVVVEKER
jgi:16S rRNA (guanine527-N7)-methyltransferase